uniref:Protein UXT-like n=1 Tax=Phallusia mammillata TaxID=59560 RepID=A0A6F9DX89_9ASCI|nr:protein UXT-like [Phallusia mammillata]
MSEVPKKVVKYEQFLNERLRGDLANLTQQRDKYYEEIAQYLQLQTIIERQLIDHTGPLKTQVDLGNNFYAQAVVPDTSMICIAVGYGFFVEFTPKEALKFIEQKNKRLNDKVDVLTKSMTLVRANIRMVLEGLKELQGVPAS